MGRAEHLRWAWWLALLASPLTALAILNRFPSLDPRWEQNTFHFYVVSGTALLAAVTCGTLVASARSLRETRLLFLALSFMSIAGVFSVHGLTTPGFLHDEPYPALSVSAWLSVLTGAVFVTASAVEWSAKPTRWVRGGGWVILLATMMGVALFMFASILIAHS